MKKTISITLLLALCLALLAGCFGAPAATPTPQVPAPTPEETAAPTPEPTPTPAAPADRPAVNLAVITGPTGIGAVKLMSDNDAGETKNAYNVTIAAAPDELTGKLVSGDLDMAALATNLALNLYNQTEEIQLLAVNTLSVLYILENGETIQSPADLKGKTIYAMGQGANPEFVLRHLLTINGIDPDKDVTIEFVSPDAIQAGMVSGEMDVALLAMPAAMGAVMKGDNTRLALSLGDLWAEQIDGELAMGCIAVRKSFAAENPQIVADFLEEYAASVSFMKENVDEAAELVAQYGITPSAAIAKASIPLCNLVCITGTDAQFTLQDYYKVLFDANPKSIGGFTPDDGFYYAS